MGSIGAHRTLEIDRFIEIPLVLELDVSFSDHS